jgi:hypothetical protein
MVVGDPPEQEPETRSGGTKPSRRRHRQVELERPGQQEDAIGRRAPVEVDEMDRIKLVDQGPRPVTENVADRHRIGDTKGEVQVGVAIAAVRGERADDGPGDERAHPRRPGAGRDPAGHRAGRR